MMCDYNRAWNDGFVTWMGSGCDFCYCCSICCVLDEQAGVPYLFISIKQIYSAMTGTTFGKTTSGTLRMRVFLDTTVGVILISYSPLVGNKQRLCCVVRLTTTGKEQL